MSRWRKLGLLYGPNSQATKHIKLISHFSTPVPIHVEKDIYRIFYSGRDELNRSSVGAVEINIKEGTIVQEFSKPFLEFGPRGSFYSEGIKTTVIVTEADTEEVKKVEEGGEPIFK